MITNTILIVNDGIIDGYYFFIYEGDQSHLNDSNSEEWPEDLFNDPITSEQFVKYIPEILTDSCKIITLMCAG